MSDKEKNPKLIPLRDFIYLCVIVGVILIAVVSYFLGDSSRAGENLNFAATTVSVVLAVIAIIMTIVDSAGQKQNVFDMKKAIEVMQETLRDEKEVVEEFKEQLIAVEQNRSELMNEVKNFIALRDEIMQIIDKTSENGGEVKSQTIAEIEKTVQNYNILARANHASYALEISIKHDSYRKKLDKASIFTSYLRNNDIRVRDVFVAKNSDLVRYFVHLDTADRNNLMELLDTYSDETVNLIKLVKV